MRKILLIMSILILTPVLVQANSSDYLGEKITHEDIPNDVWNVTSKEEQAYEVTTVCYH